MADSHVATRAPESDAQEDQPTETPEEQQQTQPSTLSSTDTRAQSGPSMGDHCTTDRPLPGTSAATSAQQPAGEIMHLASIQTYISKPPHYPQEPGKLLLLLTGGTGLNSPNNQIQADAYASRGFLVVMPDQFGGDPAPNSGSAPIAHHDSTQETGLLEKIKLGAAETAKTFMIDMWLARHTPEKVLPIVQNVLGAAKEQFADAVANGGGIYGAGYCFGAKYILLLLGVHPDTVAWGQKSAGTDPEKGESVVDPALKAGAIAHGTMVTKEDVEAVKRPIAMACVAGDALFPDEVREQGRASLELSGVEHEVSVFEGVPHGFAVLGDFGDETIAEKQKEAFELMCGWLEQH